jgi:hypothetical protein
MRTQALLDRICEELTSNYGDMLMASQRCGVSMQFIKQWRKDDSKTDEIIREAEAMGAQGLVSAAIQRGVHGVEEPVFNRGVIVGHITKYSDSLLTTLLKAKVDDFKPNSEAQAPNVTVNVANIMPRANTYEEWLAMRDMTNNPQPALPAPKDDNVIDVDFKAVEPAPAFAGIEL